MVELDTNQKVKEADQRQEGQRNAWMGFWNSYVMAIRFGEAQVLMRGVFDKYFMERALSREDAEQDQKKALAEQFLEDIERADDFRVEVDRAEGSDLATYWFVRNHK